MTRNLPPFGVLLGLMGLVVAAGGCDCEDRIRKAISNRGAKQRQQKQAPDSGASLMPPPAESAPREMEPNNTKEQASLIQIDEDLRAVHGSISNNQDIDLYKVTAPKGTILIVKLVAKSPSLSPKLAVSASSAKPQDYTPQKDGSIVAYHIGVVHQPLYLHVSADKGTGEYELQFKLRLTSGSLETEPNGEALVATPLQIPGATQGYYDRAKDLDLYQLLPLKAKGLEVCSLRIEGIDGLTHQLTLFEGAQAATPLLEMESKPGEALQIPNVQVSSGQSNARWIRLMPKGHDSSLSAPYSIQLLGHPQLEDDQALEAEPNDTPETAQTISPSNSIHGYLHHPKDVDWFQGESVPRQKKPPARVMPSPPVDTLFPPLLVKQAPLHNYEVTLNPKAASSVLRIVWKDPNDKLRHLSATKPGDTVFWCPQSNKDSLPKFGVQFSNEKNTVNTGFDYELVVRDASTSSSPFEVEPNNTKAQADRLVVGVVHQGRLFSTKDTDFWALDWVPKDAGSMGEVRFELQSHPDDLSFELLDSQGLALANINNAGPGGVETTSLSLPKGRYFVAVRNRAGGTCQPYRLVVKK